MFMAFYISLAVPPFSASIHSARKPFPFLSVSPFRSPSFGQTSFNAMHPPPAVATSSLLLRRGVRCATHLRSSPPQLALTASQLNHLRLLSPANGSSFRRSPRGSEPKGNYRFLVPLSSRSRFTHPSIRSPVFPIVSPLFRPRRELPRYSTATKLEANRKRPPRISFLRSCFKRSRSPLGPRTPEQGDVTGVEGRRNAEKNLERL